jgi:hypothetical protein
MRVEIPADRVRLPRSSQTGMQSSSAQRNATRIKAVLESQNEWGWERVGRLSPDTGGER